MNVVKIAAIAQIAGGVLGVASGGFIYAKEAHGIKVRPVDLSVRGSQTLNVPIWAGAGALAIGGVLLFLARTRH